MFHTINKSGIDLVIKISIKSLVQLILNHILRRKSLDNLNADIILQLLRFQIYYLMMEMKIQRYINYNV